MGSTTPGHLRMIEVVTRTLWFTRFALCASDARPVAGRAAASLAFVHTASDSRGATGTWSLAEQVTTRPCCPCRALPRLESCSRNKRFRQVRWPGLSVPMAAMFWEGVRKETVWLACSSASAKSWILAKRRVGSRARAIRRTSSIGWGSGDAFP